MVLMVKNRFKIEMLIFLLTGMGLLIGVGSPTPGKGVGECLVTIRTPVHLFLGLNPEKGLLPDSKVPEAVITGFQMK